MPSAAELRGARTRNQGQPALHGSLSAPPFLPLPHTAVPLAAPNPLHPQVLALVDNGRIEQFLNCITLTPQQMCGDAFVPRIAALLASFHAVRVDLPREPQLFPTIRRWLDMARSLEFPDPSDAKAKAYATLDFAKIESELDQTEAACAASRSPVVWGHNDLLSGNLLVVQRPGFDPAAPDLAGPLTVIDFEYGAYTYR